MAVAGSLALTAYSVVLIGIVLLITLLARAAEDGRRRMMALRS
jgi:hypothetical protein